MLALINIFYACRAALLEDVSDGEAPCLFDVLKKNPAALAMMQNKLQGMVGLNSGYYDSLPNVVKRRVKALKNIQVDVLKVEAEFAEAVHQLEVKFSEKFQPLYEKRTKIVSGEYEPKDDECDFPSDVEDEEDEEDKQNGKKEETEEEKKKKADEATALHGMDETTKGIPEFWLTIFKNVELIGANIQEHDEPVLAHLTDVQVKLNSRPMGFTLEFHFSPNEYFTDTVLTKEYEIKAEVDPEDPFSFEGAEISKCKGCDIHWKKGKNVTVRSVSKKQKHKSKGNVRTVNKEVPNDSFFNFFSPPQGKIYFLEYHNFLILFLLISSS